MFSRGRHKRGSSNNSSRAASAAAEEHDYRDAPLVSPLSSPLALDMTFDFELPAATNSDSTTNLADPFSPLSHSNSNSAARPQTSDGLASLRGRPLQSPELPSMPQVASRDTATMSGQEHSQGGSRGGLWDDGEVFLSASKKRPSFEHPTTVMSSSRSTMPASPTSRPPERMPESPRPQTTGGPPSSTNSTPRMEASLFPIRSDTPVLPPTTNMPAMNRSFIDSRDKPYSPPQRPVMLQGNHSSPNLLRPMSPAIGARGPTPIYSSRISPHDSVHNLSSSRTNWSGSTARPSTQASSRTAVSGGTVVTIGTPYQATADSFPLPQHVATRPKTPGASAAKVGGVSVPTHHTSSFKPDKKEQPKKKGRLLNPMALLQRRRSSQDPEVVVEERAARQAQAQALARQRDVLTSGPKPLPPDFDPRIKGKLVHDFSAPREKRNTFDEMDMPLSWHAMQSPNGTPVLSPIGYPPRNASLVNRGPLIDQNQRRSSSHTPIFKEHLGENPESSRRISSIQAENLENKDFLQRASKHSAVTSFSQESAVLPPFARRSQMLDPTQASFYQDDDSSPSSNPSSEKERNSNLDSISEVSPVTARNSGFQANARASFSPVSPTGSSRPDSQMSKTMTDYSAMRPVSQSSKTSMSEQRSSDIVARPYSVVLAPPQIETIAEGSVESSPIDTYQRHASGQSPQLVVRGTSFRQSNSPSPAAELSQPSRQGIRTESPATQALLDRTAEIETPDQTPELMQDAMAFKTQSTAPKLVEKRKSAVGHSRRSTNIPKHHPSNASRFSFQFGESAAQEHALEEKHRNAKSREIAQSFVQGRSPDEEDEEDYFDEDAMDDMDELEMQQSSPDEDNSHLQIPGVGKSSNASPSQSSLYLQQARQALQLDSDDDRSIYDEDIPEITDERELPYADHPAFRAHSALGNYSRNSSIQHDAPDGYWRDSTIDHYMRDSYAVSTHSQPQLQVPGSSFYMHPQAAGYSPNGSPVDTKPPVPSRDSGNSERNRAVSGMSFDSPVGAPGVRSADETIDSAHTSRGASDEAQKPAKIDSEDLESTNLPHGEHLRKDSETMGLASPVQRPGSFDAHSPARDVPAAIIVQRPESVEKETLTQPSSLANEHNQNKSSDRLSLVSPTRSDFSEKSRESEMSFEDFASSGFLGSHAAQAHREPSGMGSMAPSINTASDEKQTMVATDSKVSSPQSASTGLGLNMFAGFNFGGSATLIPLDSTTADAGVRSVSSPAGMTSLNEFNPGSRSSPSMPNQFYDGAKTKNENDVKKSQPPSDIFHSRFRSQQPVAGAHIGSDPKAGPGDQTISPAHRLSSFGGFDFNETGSTHEAFEAASTDKAHHSNLGTRVQETQAIPHAREGSPMKPTSPTPSDPSTIPKRTIRSHLSNPSEGGQSAIYSGSIGSHLPLRSPTSPNAQQTRSATSNSYDDAQDDMYFDDGNFDQDISETHGVSIDENAFDDDNFLYRPNAAVNQFGHSRDRSSAALTFVSAGSGGDGPYPSFAVPNAAKAQARYSQLMLEDLPLQTPIDPKLIPQRNPSEDAKRMGRSDKAPPIPVLPSNEAAYLQMQESLQQYHAALANAANQAAADGRFTRTLSVSTQHSSRMPGRLDINDGNADALSFYSHDEDGGEIPMPHSPIGVDRSDTTMSHLTHITNYSPPKLSFDFGFNDRDDDYENDDDLVAAANAEALASDDEGFYGQEFQFFGRPRANSGDLEAVNGGYFGDDGDNGVQRNKSLKEPNLTPITERSEFSTRNSFIGMLPGTHPPPSAGGYGPHSPALARMPITPLMEDDITSFDELRRLRAHAFGGSQSSVKSANSNRSSQQSLHGVVSPTLDTTAGAAFAHHSSYFGSPMQFAYSSGSNGSSNPSTAHPVMAQNYQNFNYHQDSPLSAASSNGNPFAMDIDATPKRNTTSSQESPQTARKMPPAVISPTHSQSNGFSHSRKGSSTDSVTYVREPDPDGGGKPRWVLERRRTSEQGQLELIGRELVQGGWI